MAALLLAPAVAQSRVGTLDPGFGEGGRVVTSFRPTDYLRMAVAPDGSTVLVQIARSGIVSRFLPDGRPDPGFGAAGQTVLPESVDGLRFSARRVAVDSQGRVLLFGIATDTTQRVDNPDYLLSTPVSWAVVVRLKANGELDTSFGGGKGFVRGDFGLRTELIETDLPTVEILAAAVDSQDRPVFIAGVAGLTGSCSLSLDTYIARFPRAVVRLTAEGSPDPGFGGGDGISPIRGSDGIPVLALDGADQPVASVPSGCRGSEVFRLGSDGTPLAGFGTNGARRYSGLLLSAVEPAGSMILENPMVIYRSQRIDPRVVVKTLGDGNADPSFGKAGRASVKMPAGAWQALAPVGADAEGRILLVGSFSLPAPPKPAHGRMVRHHKRKPRREHGFLAVSRLLANGKTDASFGRRGWIITGFQGARHVDVDSAALDPQGHLVVLASPAGPGSPPGNRPTLIRYLLG